MFVAPSLSGDYALGVPGNLNLEKYGSISLENWSEAHKNQNLDSLIAQIHQEGNVLFYGYNSVENLELQQIFKDVSNKILLNLWAPCEYMNQGSILKHDALEQTEYFDTIYSICPYTIQWLQNYHGDTKHKYIFHPYVGDYAPENFDKKADVCYFGGVHSQAHADFLGVMKKFDYRLMTLQNTFYCDEKDITHLAVPLNEKMDLIAGTKATVCYNMLPLTDQHLLYIKQYDNWEENEAYSHLDQYIAPQYKCRVAEAAFCKSVILMKRDPWNIVEDYFVPEEEFIYWDTLEDLEEKIEDISTNFHKYEEMIEKAYQKSLQYTAKPLFDIIKAGNEWTPNV